MLCVYQNLFYVVDFYIITDTATSEIYTLSLHDALPILRIRKGPRIVGEASDRSAGGIEHLSACVAKGGGLRSGDFEGQGQDRKSTRLNSSHSQISYAVFCLKKKKNCHVSV